MARPISMDKERVAFNLARLKKGGATFEIAVDPDMAVLFKQGKADFLDVIKGRSVFADVSRGLNANDDEIERVFGTTDIDAVIKRILEDGEIQFTAEYRDKLRAEKKKRIIQLIHINAIDPKTKTPHPVARLEGALDEVKFKIDEFKAAEAQVEDAIQKLRTLLPIRVESMQVDVHVGATHAHKVYGMLKSLVTVQQENWSNDGSLMIRIEFPAGLQEDVFDKINSATHGGAEMHIRE